MSRDIKGALRIVKLFLESHVADRFAPVGCIKEILPYVVISSEEKDEDRTVQLINLALKNVRDRRYDYMAPVNQESVCYHVTVDDLVEFEALIRAQCAAEFARKAKP